MPYALVCEKLDPEKLVPDGVLLYGSVEAAVADAVNMLWASGLVWETGIVNRYYGINPSGQEVVIIARTGCELLEKYQTVCLNMQQRFHIHKILPQAVLECSPTSES